MNIVFAENHCFSLCFWLDTENISGLLIYIRKFTAAISWHLTFDCQWDWTFIQTNLLPMILLLLIDCVLRPLLKPWDFSRWFECSLLRLVGVLLCHWLLNPNVYLLTCFRPLCTQGLHSTTELTTQPLFHFLFWDRALLTCPGGPWTWLCSPNKQGLKFSYSPTLVCWVHGITGWGHKTQLLRQTILSIYKKKKKKQRFPLYNFLALLDVRLTRFSKDVF